MTAWHELVNTHTSIVLTGISSSDTKCYHISKAVHLRNKCSKT